MRLDAGDVDDAARSAVARFGVEALLEAAFFAVAFFETAPVEAAFFAVAFFGAAFLGAAFFEAAFFAVAFFRAACFEAAFSVLAVEVDLLDAADLSGPAFAFCATDDGFPPDVLAADLGDTFFLAGAFLAVALPPSARALEAFRVGRFAAVARRLGGGVGAPIGLASGSPTTPSTGAPASSLGRAVSGT